MFERRQLLAIAAGVLMLPRRVAAQATPSAGTGDTLGLGIIGLHVADRGASLDFYRRLGLNIPTKVDLSGEAFRLRLPTGQVSFWETIAYTRRYFPDYERGTGQRKVALEFGFQTPREVDEMYTALLAAGYASYKEPLSWGSIRYAGVVDPDDNQIALRFPLASKEIRSPCSGERSSDGWVPRPRMRLSLRSRPNEHGDGGPGSPG